MTGGVRRNRFGKERSARSSAATLPAPTGSTTSGGRDGTTPPKSTAALINDLMGHGVDFVHWIARPSYAKVLSATRACIGLPQHPTFETFGDAYYRLDGNASVVGHVDYLGPAGHPTAWRCFVCWLEGRRSHHGNREAAPPQGRPPGPRLKAEELPADAHSVHRLRRHPHRGNELPAHHRRTLHCSLAALVSQQAAVQANSAGDPAH